MDVDDRGWAEVVNCGHPPPLRRDADGRVGSLSPQQYATALGCSPALRSNTFTLTPQDRLVLYTDGLLDAHDPAGACSRRPTAQQHHRGRAVRRGPAASGQCSRAQRAHSMTTLRCSSSTSTRRACAEVTITAWAVTLAVIGLLFAIDLILGAVRPHTVG